MLAQETPSPQIEGHRSTSCPKFQTTRTFPKYVYKYMHSARSSLNIVLLVSVGLQHGQPSPDTFGQHGFKFQEHHREQTNAAAKRNRRTESLMATHGVLFVHFPVASCSLAAMGAAELSS